MNGKALVKRVENSFIIPALTKLYSEKHRLNLFEIAPLELDGYMFVIVDLRYDGANIEMKISISVSGSANAKTLAKFILFGLSEESAYSIDDHIYKINKVEYDGNLVVTFNDIGGNHDNN